MENSIAPSAAVDAMAPCFMLTLRGVENLRGTRGKTALPNSPLAGLAITSAGRAEKQAALFVTSGPYAMLRHSWRLPTR